MSMGRLNIFRRDHVSFVFQNVALMKYYTVAENIEMPLLSMNVGKKERKKIIEEKSEERNGRNRKWTYFLYLR